MTNKKANEVKQDIEALLKKHGVDNYYIMFGDTNDVFVKGHVKDGTQLSMYCSAFTAVLIANGETKKY
ncbi:hypothetical protein [Emticicia sp. BO119]|uniref:hypothetical protein n=1 Tax=Emticicia sp. BO119 TaxID=2757768 RepID=UPI0015F06856|nr:hypothetical protein [Emticicia sp. BO119]MBA4849469.1 hypothetical protein [Emticicia sp. BO119]